ncbi:MAG: hypothetical protein OER21_15530, partial [Gemmatimonadota bacterium]|nr:hypothetical protein [Gemmatimonadota bacterium]
RVPFRWVALAGGAAIVASTFVLGVHWVADIVAGVAVGLMSVALALRLERRWEDASQAVTPQTPLRPASRPSPAERTA